MIAMLTPTPPKGTGMPVPTQYRWTRQKYEQATALGLLGPDDRVELIEGEIIEKMPQNSSHSTALRLTEKALSGVFTEGYDVRGQLPLSVGDFSQPEPDIAVVTGSPRDYKDSQPTADRAALVVEISDTSLLYDQTQKVGIYARAGIADYWIVNLAECVLEIHRQPVLQEDAPLGHAYAQILRLAETETIAPLAAEGMVIAVADLLP